MPFRRFRSELSMARSPKFRSGGAGGDEATGRGICQSQCNVCHGDNLAGSSRNFQALTRTGDRMSPLEIVSVTGQGKGRMSAFTNLNADQVSAIVDYVLRGEKMRSEAPQFS